MITVMLALAILAAGVIGSIVLMRWPRAALAASLGGAGAAGLLSAGAALHALLSGSASRSTSMGWSFPIGTATLAIDGLSAWFLLVIGIASVAVAVYSWGYFLGGIGQEPVWAAGALLAILVAAMIITVCAADVILFFVGWELMSLSAFLLVGFHHRHPATQRGAWMYLIATHLGTAIGVLPVLSAFAARAGSPSFAAFPAAFHASETAACVGLFFLGLIGFGTKAGIMPMHVWLPEAHPVAPSPVSALMSGVVIKTGIYGLLRLLTWLPPLPRSCAWVVVGVAVVTGVMGILYALAQRQYKRMLAYSSVENIGIIVIGVGLGMLGRTAHQPILAALGFGGALLHVLNHALFKGLLFLSAGAVLHGTGVDDMERLGGLARRNPLNAGLFAVGCVAICALPPLNGFVGEFLIYSGLLRGAASNSQMVSAIALVGVGGLALIGGLALAGFSKLFGVMFLGEPRDAGVHSHATPPFMLAGMFLLAICCIVVAVGAPLLGGVLSAPLAPLIGEGLGVRAHLDPALSPLVWVGAASLLTIGLVGALVAIRRRSLSVTSELRQVTWGCGYSAPTPRMQYSGSSYVWNLAHSFRQLLRSRRNATRREGCFIAPCSLHVESSDVAVQKGYRPAFLFVARTFERLWPLQHGRIQLYLMYIVATLLLVFAAEAWVSPFSSGKSPAEQRPSAAGARPADPVQGVRWGGDKLP